jgi:hypothetical protein
MHECRQPELVFPAEKAFQGKHFVAHYRYDGICVNSLFF